MAPSEHTNDLILIRGLPGSGKSTLAKRLADRVHLETDQWFSRGGVYKFDKALANDAHKWCLDETRKALEEGRDVVVSNTFVTLKELQPYFALGWPTRVFEADGNYRTIHGVPDKAIERMRAKWQPYEDAEPLDAFPADTDVAAPATLPPEEQQDREVFDLILSGHPTPAILEYVETQGYGDPSDVAVRAVQRFTGQATGIPVATQCGYLLDAHRELARKSAEIGDFQGARACLKEYFGVVKYLNDHGLVRGLEPADDTEEAPDDE